MDEVVSGIEAGGKESKPGRTERRIARDADYWRRRQDSLYYQIVKVLGTAVAKDAEAVLDVGAKGCPHLEWFDFVEERVSLDLKLPYFAPGVTSITGDFLDWTPHRHFELVTCLQVLEHVPRAEEFAQKLLKVADVVVVSVPYRWPAGRHPDHVNDPVDEKKMLAWFGRPPNFTTICREITNGYDRLIQVYDDTGQQWQHLRQRTRLKRRGARSTNRLKIDRLAAKAAKLVGRKKR
jgi:hypothetical protein